MKRTKGQIRGSKSKGRTFERDCEASLKQVFPDIYMTHEKGYVQQYDLRDDVEMFVVECKRHKYISWNQAKKWFDKLKSVTPEGYAPMLIFKSNQQPVLCMAPAGPRGSIQVMEFEDFCWVPFIKHEPVKSERKKGKVNNEKN